MRQTLLRVLPLLTVVCAGCVAWAARAAPPTSQPSTQPSTGPSTRPADPTIGEYIEYRAQPALGRISISDCAVRGAKAVRHLVDHAADLAKEGVFACPDDDARHVYRRSETMAGRKIDTLIVIEPPPPADAGDDAGDGTQRLVIRVDGRKKVDCTIGLSADQELWVGQVVIHPEDGTLEFQALTSDGEELTLPSPWDSLDDGTVITDKSFFEDGPPEEEKKPLKV